MASWLGLLLLVMASGGGYPTDLASLIDVEAYFQSRKVDLTAAQMAVLAGKEPADAKAQIGQHLALRWLGDHPDAVKADPKTRALIEAIAQGKTAQDPQEFARDYAKRALARLDGKPSLEIQVSENSLRADGVAWFPSGVALLCGIENRGPPLGPVIDLKAITATFHQALPAEAREEMYKFADDVGNLEVLRFTLAYSVDPNEKQNNRVYLRLTGRCDHRRLAEYLTRVLPGAAVKDEKGPKGEPLTIFTPATAGPAIAFIGDTELVMAGYDHPKDYAKQVDVLREVLEVRAGRLAGVGKGAWEAKLHEVSATAKAFFAGELPDELRKELLSGGPFKEMPSDLVADMTPDKGLVIRFRGAFGSGADAKTFCDAAEQLKQQGLLALKNLPPSVKIKPKGIEALSKTLEGIKIEPKESSAIGELRVPGDRMPTLAEVMEDLLKSIVERTKG
jgi:hypothetical protein